MLCFSRKIEKFNFILFYTLLNYNIEEKKFSHRCCPYPESLSRYAAEVWGLPPSIVSIPMSRNGIGLGPSPVIETGLEDAKI
jgi:hypothetical protein